MGYQDQLVRARRLLDDVLAEIQNGRPDAEIAATLRSVPVADLWRARRLIDLQLQPSELPLPLEIVNGGQAFREWLADELELDHERARRLLTFIDVYASCPSEGGRAPAIAELADHAELSVATINRRLAEFRAVFPGERDPQRLAASLRRALDDLSLWDSPDQSIEATIGDVPVLPAPRRAMCTPAG